MKDEEKYSTSLEEMEEFGLQTKNMCICVGFNLKNYYWFLDMLKTSIGNTVVDNTENSFSVNLLTINYSIMQLKIDNKEYNAIISDKLDTVLCNFKIFKDLLVGSDGFIVGQLLLHMVKNYLCVFRSIPQPHSYDEQMMFKYYPYS